MTIELNQFAPNEPLAGLYVYMANLPQLHTVLVSASQSAALKAGDIVTVIDLLRTLLHVSSNAAGYIFGAFVGKKLAEKEVK